MSRALVDLLPPVYSAILPAWFEAAAPSETRSTCDDCAMTGDEEARSDENVTFLATTKCCTFQPQLPNYLVGALLRDDAPELAEGRRRIRAQIESRQRVTPRWVAPSRVQRELYRAARHEAFGRSEALLCAYYDAGTCTVWKYRESYCTTFFCKHDAGETGRQFWRHLRRYLDESERVLSRYLATTIAPDHIEPKPLMTLEELEGEPPHERDYASWWGAFVGREEELYCQTAEMLETLDQDTFQRLLTQSAKRRLPLLENARDAVDTATLPKRLMKGAFVTAEPMTDSTNVRVSGYSQYDPMVMSRDRYDCVAQLTDARPAAEVVEALGGDEELTRRLVQWRILASPEQRDI